MTSMRVMAGVLTLVACGTEPEQRVNLGDVVGRWHVTLTEPPTCNRNNPAPALDLDVAALGRTGEDTVTLQGTWGLAPTTNPTLDLLGTLDLRTGSFHADLTGTQPNLVGRLAGTMGLETGLTGTLTDPAPGGNPILGFGSCTYTAVGQH